MEHRKFIFIETGDGRELSYPRQGGEPDYDSLRVDYCSYLWYREDWKSGDLMNGYYWEFVYVVSGELMCCVLAETARLTTGDILVVRPGTRFSFETRSPEETVVIRIGFHGGHIDVCLQQAGIARGMSVCHGLIPDKMKEAAETILSSRGDGILGDVIRAREVYGILAEIIRSKKGVTQESDSTDNLYIHSAMNFIQQHYSENIDVQSIADYLGISRTYFTVLFQKITGNTPSRYLMNVRMKAAERLLASTDMLVADVAERCGFANAYSFSTSFRKRYGKSPAQFRKDAGAAEGEIE